ncbi:MAG TPA: hypothetical protein VGF02_05080, partial [Pseudolabrys sp.]
WSPGLKRAGVLSFLAKSSAKRNSRFRMELHFAVRLLIVGIIVAIALFRHAGADETTSRS